MNPVIHVEIPVADLDRAMRLYAAVFGVIFGDVVSIHDNRMAFFPFEENAEGASVALAQGDAYVPSLDGAIIYFAVTDIDAVLAAAGRQGAEILLPRTTVDGTCSVAEFRGSEGNRIALQTS